MIKEKESSTASAMRMLEHAGMTSYNHWCNWQNDAGKKPPFYQDPTGRFLPTKINDSRTWLPHADVSRHFGHGFVLSTGDPFCCIDLDDCITDGIVDGWADVLVREFASYTEVSPSGNGLHIWTMGNVGNVVHKKDQKVEIYSHSRYMTVTYVPYNLEPIRPRQQMLERLVSRLDKVASVDPQQARESKNTVPDALIIRYALGGKSASKFARLYKEGNIEGYGSASDADFALLAMLRFWCSADYEKMDRIFRTSALMRPKWDEVHGESTYGKLTINRVLDANQSSPIWHPRSS